MADGTQLPADSTSSHPPPLLTQPPPPPLTRPPPLAHPPPLTCPPPRPPPPRAQLLCPPVKLNPAISDGQGKSKSETSLKLEDKDDEPKSLEGGLLLGKRPSGSITMKLKPQSEAKRSKTELPTIKTSKPLSKSVAKAFGSDSEDEEEMPAEAKLKMRNVGKNTPTSAGPNSFNKSKSGFSDPRGSWRNEIQD